VLGAGDAFPDRILGDPEGQAHRVSPAWSGGPALIALGHAECGTTRLALPYVQRLWTRRGAGSSVLAVLQEDAAGARALASELGLTLPLRLDETPYPLSREVGLRTVPSFFLVGRDGRVVRTAEGWSRDDLEAFAAALGSGGPLFGAGEEGPRHRPG
jgi:hypothetical protein